VEGWLRMRSVEGWLRMRSVEGWLRMRSVEGWLRMRSVEGWLRMRSVESLAHLGDSKTRLEIADCLLRLRLKRLDSSALSALARAPHVLEYTERTAVQTAEVRELLRRVGRGRWRSVWAQFHSGRLLNRKECCVSLVTAGMLVKGKASRRCPRPCGILLESRCGLLDGGVDTERTAAGCLHCPRRTWQGAAIINHLCGSFVVPLLIAGGDLQNLRCLRCYRDRGRWVLSHVDWRALDRRALDWRALDWRASDWRTSDWWALDWPALRGRGGGLDGMRELRANR